MTPGKAGGLLGEPLKGVSKPLAASRQIVCSSFNLGLICEHHSEHMPTRTHAPI